MFCNINKEPFLPSKQEVAECTTQNHGYEEPNIVRHHDQHEEIR